jgi:DNA (cytosine-5)-methyltransferase 1
MRKLRVLDLFSGIGGFSLGLERTGGFETVAFCEYAGFPRKVLAKHWPDVPIYPDIRELTAERLDADGIAGIDLICGGYPCQPFSHAGKRLGAEDDRHLWPEVRRLIETLRPAWVIGENVAGHVSMGLDDVLSDLDGLGYAAQAFVIPACAVNAPHRRDRVWIVAYAERGAGQAIIQRELNSILPEAGARRPAARFGAGNVPIGKQWEFEPGVGRVANGVPNRSHRLKALGNAVVPQIPEMIGRAILRSMEAA